MGGATLSGTLIMPSYNKTYLVHCDLAQHMEKGMKGQIKVGRGSGDLTSIPYRLATLRTESAQLGSALFCNLSLPNFADKPVILAHGDLHYFRVDQPIILMYKN